jgi:replicative DNA helicase
MLATERRTLSSIINNKDIAHVISDADADKIFELTADIWEFMKDYYYKYRAVTPPEVIEEAFQDFKLIETSGEVKHYLDQHKAEYKRSWLERIMRGASKSMHEGASTEEVLAAVNSKLTDLTNIGNSIRDLDITDADKANEHYAERKRAMEECGGVLGTKTMFASIDANYVTGLDSGHYVVILSRTNQGKSWLALQVAINAWKQGKKVLYVSLEMPPESVRDRAYTFMSQGMFKMSELSRATMSLEAMQVWTAESFGNDGSFVVTASDGMGDFNPAHLQAKIDQYAPDIVVVDYLQLMADRRNSSDSTARVRNTSKEVKSLAMSNEVPIVMVAAASVNETKEYFSPPQIYECAESRQAVYDVDLCLSLISHKQSDGSFLMEVISRKNRHGPLFDFLIKLDIANGTMDEQFDTSLLE